MNPAVEKYVVRLTAEDESHIRANWQWGSQHPLKLTPRPRQFNSGGLKLLGSWTRGPAQVLAHVVGKSYFAGLTMPEAAAAFGVSLATAERYWTFAKAWLHSELAEDSTPEL